MPVLLLPIERQTRRDSPQQMTGQMRHAHPRQDEQTGVVGEQAQMAAARWATPADPPVPGGGLPGSRAKEQTGQRSAVRGLGQVFQALAYAVAVSQIMVSLQEPLEEPGLRSACGQRLDSNRLEQLQRTFQGTLVVIDGRAWAIAQTVHRSRLARGQLDLALGLQLEQQAASGHVLEPADAVPPVPGRTQLTRESRPIRIRMGLQPVSNQRDILGADRPPLYDQLSVHGPTNTQRKTVSPEKMENIFSSGAGVWENHS